MRKPIYMVGGSKGGVGKSFLTMAILDYLHDRNEQLLLVETDTSNPDTYKTYKDKVETLLVDLDEADGWIRVVNACENRPDSIVVVNTAARSSTGVTHYGGTLGKSLQELKRRLVTLWVINRQRDSLELLKEFMTAMPEGQVHVVRNGYFGDETKYELYNSSHLRETVEGKGGLSLTFPDLADRVADDLYCKRLTIADALTHSTEKLPIGNRAELVRWRGEVAKMLGGLLDARA